MREEDRSSRALKLVSQAQATKEPAQLAVRHELPIFNGTLYIVNWFSAKDNRDYDNYVYFKGEEAHFFYNPAELTRFLDLSRKRSNLVEVLRDVLTVGGVPAVLGVIITITICYLAAFRGIDKLQDNLGNALSIVLGFYFGSKVGKDSPHQDIASRESTRRMEG